MKAERMEEGTDLNDVQHRRELAEQQHFMFPPEQFPKESIQHHHLPTCIDQLFTKYGHHRIRIDRPIEQEWVGTHFPKLHHCVLKFHVVHLQD